jgi:cytochrome c
MASRQSKSVATVLAFVGAAVLGTIMAVPAMAEHVAAETRLDRGARARLVLPIMSPERGKKLFVTKGCVACHAINGVGGHDAPNMDAHLRMGLVNPFDFAAKMWNHAPGMIYAQEEALGGQVFFTGEELADIIAFVHDDQGQHSFSEADLTPEARKMMHHEHGEKTAPEADAKELGHHHAPGAPKHED